jgi:hypothetical protein
LMQARYGRSAVCHHHHHHGYVRTRRQPRVNEEEKHTPVMRERGQRSRIGAAGEGKHG